MPTSYSSLAFSLIWNAVSHVLFQVTVESLSVHVIILFIHFQLFIGRMAVGLMSLFINKGKKLSSRDNPLKDPPLSVGHEDIAQTIHLLHQISLAGKEEATTCPPSHQCLVVFYIYRVRWSYNAWCRVLSWTFSSQLR